MSIRHRCSVFATAARLGAKQILAEPLTLIGIFIPYAAVVVAYGNLFRAIPAGDLALYHLTLPQMIWYFGITELVVFCCPSPCFRELQYDIQTNQIYLSLLRPCSVWLVRIGEWCGQSAARFLVLGFPCLTLTAFMANEFSPGLGHFLGFIASLPLAFFILLCSLFIAGVSCLWLKQSEPAFWVWQKCLFLLGALIWPLAIYPPFLRHAVWFTPFPAILAVPAQWAVTEDFHSLAGGIVHQFFWAAVFAALTALVTHAVLRRIQISGE